MSILTELEFSRRRKIPVVLAAEAAECGLACLTMIARFHGHDVDLNGLRQRVALSLSGATLRGLMEIADGLGFQSRPLRAELSALGLPFTLVSEEVGVVPVHGGGPVTVVVDPIDGSFNAKRGLPVFCTSIALAEGSAMGDVVLGLVRDHGTGEEWTAERGRGAWLDGAPVVAGDAGGGGAIELLLVEGAFPERIAALAGMFEGRVGRLRMLGSLALSLCQVAAGRGDAMVALGPGRTVDVAAAQLVAREAGLLVGLPDVPSLAPTPLDLDVRFHVTAASDAATLDLLGRVAAR